MKSKTEREKKYNTKMESFICNFVEVDLIGDYLGSKQIADMEINSLYASFVKNAGTNVGQNRNLMCQDTLET